MQVKSQHTVLGIATAIAVAAIRTKGHPEEGRALAHELSVIGKDVLAGFVHTDEFFEALGQAIDDEREAGKLVQQPGFPQLTGNAKADGRAITSWLKNTGPEGSPEAKKADRADQDDDEALVELLNSMFGAPERKMGCSEVEPTARGSEKGRKLVPGCAIGGCSVYADKQ